MVAGARTGIFGAYRGQMGCGVGSADSSRLGGALGGGVCSPLPADGVAVLGETKRAGGGSISWVGARWRSPATHLEMPGAGLVFGEPLSPPGCAPQNGATPHWGGLCLPGGPPLSLSPSRAVGGGVTPPALARVRGVPGVCVQVLLAAHPLCWAPGCGGHRGGSVGRIWPCFLGAGPLGWKVGAGSGWAGTAGGCPLRPAGQLLGRAADGVGSVPGASPARRRGFLEGPWGEAAGLESPAPHPAVPPGCEMGPEALSPPGSWGLSVLQAQQWGSRCVTAHPGPPAHTTAGHRPCSRGHCRASGAGTHPSNAVCVPGGWDWTPGGSPQTPIGTSWRCGCIPRAGSRPDEPVPRAGTSGPMAGAPRGHGTAKLPPAASQKLQPGAKPCPLPPPLGWGQLLGPVPTGGHSWWLPKEAGAALMGRQLGWAGCARQEDPAP